MTHKESRELAKKLCAEFKKNPRTISQMVIDTGATPYQVRHAIMQEGLKPIGATRAVSDKTLEAIGMALKKVTTTRISEELGVSSQRISQILKRAREAGIPIPR